MNTLFAYVVITTIVIVYIFRKRIPKIRYFVYAAFVAWLIYELLVLFNFVE